MENSRIFLDYIVVGCGGIGSATVYWLSKRAGTGKIHIINNFKCNCGASFEDAIHYFLECPLHLNERRTLLSNCDDININIETLLFGNDMYSYDVNSKIFGKVRTFINQSKRF